MCLCGTEGNENTEIWDVSPRTAGAMEQGTGWEGPGARCTDLNLTDSGGVRVSFPWRHFLDNPGCQGSIFPVL